MSFCVALSPILFDRLSLFAEDLSVSASDNSVLFSSSFSIAENVGRLSSCFAPSFLVLLIAAISILPTFSPLLLRCARFSIPGIDLVTSDTRERSFPVARPGTGCIGAVGSSLLFPYSNEPSLSGQFEKLSLTAVEPVSASSKLSGSLSTAYGHGE